jgi:hypothetical protein
VCAERVQGDEQLSGQVGTTEFARQKPVHLDLALAQRLGEPGCLARRSLGLAERSEQPRRVLRMLSTSKRGLEHGLQEPASGQEDADVSLWLG